MKIFVKAEIFFYHSYRETKTCSKKSMTMAFKNLCTQWVKCWGHAEKIVFASHKLKT